MTRLFTLRIWILVCVLFPLSLDAAEKSNAWLLTIEGAISPAISDYIVRGIKDADDATLILFCCKLIRRVDWTAPCATSSRAFSMRRCR